MKTKLARIAVLAFTLALMPLLQGCYDDNSVNYAFAWAPADLQTLIIVGGGVQQGGGGGGGGYP